VLIINPNTTPAMTEAIAESGAAAARPGTEIAETSMMAACLLAHSFSVVTVLDRTLDVFRAHFGAVPAPASR
jgi:Asp/Glu/hydantoin racemase